MSEASSGEDLASLTLDALRRRWRKELATAIPCHSSRDLLARALSYHLQARSAAQSLRKLHQRLDKLANGFAADHDFVPPDVQPMRAGAILVRDWNGRRYAVTVMDDGFLYDGLRYISLTAVATAITGVKWSGPRFFKLTEGDEGKAP